MRTLRSRALLAHYGGAKTTGLSDCYSLVERFYCNRKPTGGNAGVLPSNTLTPAIPLKGSKSVLPCNVSGDVEGTVLWALQHQRDAVVIGPPRSGKSIVALAGVLMKVAKILGKPPGGSSTQPRGSQSTNCDLRALYVVPSAELANQLLEVYPSLVHSTSVNPSSLRIRCSTLYETKGEDPDRQDARHAVREETSLWRRLADVASEKPHILITTARAAARCSVKCDQFRSVLRTAEIIVVDEANFVLSEQLREISAVRQFAADTHQTVLLASNLDDVFSRLACRALRANYVLTDIRERLARLAGDGMGFDECQQQLVVTSQGTKCTRQVVTDDVKPCTLNGHSTSRPRRLPFRWTYYDPPSFALYFFNILLDKLLEKGSGGDAFQMPSENGNDSNQCWSNSAEVTSANHIPINGVDTPFHRRRAGPQVDDAPGTHPRKGAKIVVFFPSAALLQFVYLLFRDVLGLKSYAENVAKTQVCSVFLAHFPDMNAKERIGVIKRFKEAGSGVMFCSDSVARGVDLGRDLTDIIQVGVTEDLGLILSRLERHPLAGDSCVTADRSSSGRSIFQQSGEFLLIVNPVETRYFQKVASILGVNFRRAADVDEKQWATAEPHLMALLSSDEDTSTMSVPNWCSSRCLTASCELMYIALLGHYRQHCQALGLHWQDVPSLVNSLLRSFGLKEPPPLLIEEVAALRLLNHSDVVAPGVMITTRRRPLRRAMAVLPFETMTDGSTKQFPVEFTALLHPYTESSRPVRTLKAMRTPLEFGEKGTPRLEDNSIESGVPFEGYAARPVCRNLPCGAQRLNKPAPMNTQATQSKLQNFETDIKINYQPTLRKARRSLPYFDVFKRQAGVTSDGDFIRQLMRMSRPQETENEIDAELYAAIITDSDDLG